LCVCSIPLCILLIRCYPKSHGYTPAAWKDYFVDRVDSIFDLARDPSDEDDDAPSQRRRPPHSSSAKKTAFTKRPSFARHGHETDPSARSPKRARVQDPSSDEDASDDNEGVPPARPRRGRRSLYKRMTSAELMDLLPDDAAPKSSADRPQSSSAPASGSTSARVQWTADDLNAIARLIIALGEARWGKLGTKGRGQALHAKVRGICAVGICVGQPMLMRHAQYPQRTEKAWEFGYHKRKDGGSFGLTVSGCWTRR
jgi:hypothetical protein